ncbi:MAG TPA: hypothetical protein VMT83_16570 [Burkholderiaceae bacterium]|nr:hypothetical protein [Burkholderiaceae bacterium]
MNITATSSNPLDNLSSLLAAGPAKACGDGQGQPGDGQEPRVHHGHHRGGGMGHALTQALQDLGLSVPSNGTSSSASSSGGGNDHDADDGSVATVRHDMRQFMHALFDAVRSQAPSGTTDASSSATGDAQGKPDFSSALSAVITQVGNGSAPSSLQSAFDQLVADLQSGGTASASAAADAGTSSGSTSGGGSAASSITLQQLLTQMQQEFGYGRTSSTVTSGAVVSTNA